VVEARDLKRSDVGLIRSGKSDPYAIVTVGSQSTQPKRLPTRLIPCGTPHSRPQSMLRQAVAASSAAAFLYVGVDCCRSLPTVKCGQEPSALRSAAPWAGANTVLRFLLQEANMQLHKGLGSQYDNRPCSWPFRAIVEGQYEAPAEIPVKTIPAAEAAEPASGLKLKMNPRAANTISTNSDSDGCPAAKNAPAAAPARRTRRAQPPPHHLSRAECSLPSATATARQCPCSESDLSRQLALRGFDEAVRQTDWRQEPSDWALASIALADLEQNAATVWYDLKTAAGYGWRREQQEQQRQQSDPSYAERLGRIELTLRYSPARRAWCWPATVQLLPQTAGPTVDTNLCNSLRKILHRSSGIFCLC
uniref:C2 domain-containing protein n=1 Tax=Macrostomum lignano TaxID=282301 RepID=A0A1I8JRL4_9PLAT